MVQPLIDHLSTRFAEVYQPHRDVTIDEAMIKFKGRSSLKQYMPLKSTKRGVKVWVAADSTNGYFSHFEVYIGKKGNSVEQGLGARVVKTLTSRLKANTIMHTSISISLCLLEDLEDKIHACGTARKDKGISRPAEGGKSEEYLCTVRISVCMYMRVCVIACGFVPNIILSNITWKTPV